MLVDLFPSASAVGAVKPALIVAAG